MYAYRSERHKDRDASLHLAASFIHRFSPPSPNRAIMIRLMNIMTGDEPLIACGHSKCHLIGTQRSTSVARVLLLQVRKLYYPYSAGGTWQHLFVPLSTMIKLAPIRSPSYTGS